MAIIKIYQNGRPINNYCRFIVDTEEDVKKIKILPKGGSMGNEVYVIDTQKTYILDSKRLYRKKL